jgi:hypothetical protein
MEVVNGLQLVYFYCIFLGEDISPTPLDQVLELALEYIAVEDFFNCVFQFSLNDNAIWTWYGLTRKGVITDRLKEGDIEDCVYHGSNVCSFLCSLFPYLRIHFPYSLVLFNPCTPWLLVAL